ncbi:MAG: hypothetical protein ACFB51_09610, partial [Anaerolineae bacterium]
PAGLPHINRQRDLAAGHHKPDGRNLLWGYAWMVRLIMEACVQLLNTPLAQRRAMLDAAARSSDAAALLGPVVERYSGPVTDMEEALAWCQAYIVQ